MNKNIRKVDFDHLEPKFRSSYTNFHNNVLITRDGVIFKIGDKVKSKDIGHTVKYDEEFATIELFIKTKGMDNTIIVITDKGISRDIALIHFENRFLDDKEEDDYVSLKSQSRSYFILGIMIALTSLSWLFMSWTVFYLQLFFGVILIANGFLKRSEILEND